MEAQQTGGKAPPFLPPSWQQSRKTCRLSLSRAGFAGFCLRLLCPSCGPLVLPNVAEFSLHALTLTTSTSTPWLARDFHFFCVGGSDSEDEGEHSNLAF